MTRRRLLEAVRHLVVEHGPDGFSVQQVTEMADVALGTFYNHFTDRLDAIDQAFEAEMLRQESGNEALLETAPDPLHGLALSACIVIRRASLDPDWAQFAATVGREGLWACLGGVDRAREMLASGVEAGQISVHHRDQALRTVGMVALAAVIALVAEGKRGEPDLDTSYRQAVQSVCGILGADTERTEQVTRWCLDTVVTASSN